MIRSMTGFGSAGHEAETMRAAVTARSLNHRFLDVTVHLPRRLQLLEAEFKDAVGRVVRRGRIELSLQATLTEGPAEEIVPSRPLIASLVRSLRDMQNEFGIEGGMSVSDLVRFPGALERAESRAPLDPQTRDTLLGLVGQALEGLDAMRVAEGERLREELDRALEAVEVAAKGIEQRAQETREPRQAALFERVRTLVSELGVEEGRLYQEVVRSVERHDVAEEIQRLRSHVAMARELLAANGGPAGKRLDFLAQELNREVNTLCSKSNDVELTNIGLELKSVVEQFREQVQNLE